METASNIAGPPLDSIRAARLALVGREALRATSLSRGFLACLFLFLFGAFSSIFRLTLPAGKLLEKVPLKKLRKQRHWRRSISRCQMRCWRPYLYSQPW